MLHKALMLTHTATCVETCFEVSSRIGAVHFYKPAIKQEKKWRTRLVRKQKKMLSDILLKSLRVILTKYLPLGPTLG